MTRLLWVWMHIRQETVLDIFGVKIFRSNRNINRASDLGAGVVVYISWLINGAGNGYREMRMLFSLFAN